MATGRFVTHTQKTETSLLPRFHKYAFYDRDTICLSAALPTACGRQLQFLDDGNLGGLEIR
jgi:hypothetical protein